MIYCPNCRPLQRAIKERRRSTEKRRYNTCPECGKLKHYESNLCRSCARKRCVELGIYPSGKKHHWYKNGKPHTSEGYILVKCPNHPAADKHGYVREHRFVVEQHIGRYLERHEIVHHLNGIRHDNRLANLAIVTKTNHPQLTLMQALRKRIRDLEAEISQQTLF